MAGLVPAVPKLNGAALKTIDITDIADKGR
jgi:hypothetical protein